jgi:hypothetical protein
LQISDSFLRNDKPICEVDIGGIHSLFTDFDQLQRAPVAGWRIRPPSGVLNE